MTTTQSAAAARDKLPRADKAVIRAAIAEVRAHPERYREAQDWFRDNAKPDDGWTPLAPILGRIQHWTDRRYRPDLDPVSRRANENAEREAMRIVYVAWLLGDVDAPDTARELLPWPDWQWPDDIGDTRWTLAENRPSNGWTELVIDALQRLGIDVAEEGKAERESPGDPAPVSDDAALTGFTPGELAGKMKCASDTVAAYAKAAHVDRPGRGKRNHRYAGDDLRKILEYAASSAGNEDTKNCARELLAETGNKPEYQK